MKKKTLRLLFVGYGHLGQHLAAKLAQEPWCRIVAVADPHEAALEKATSLFQVSTFSHMAMALEATDADVAVINTPLGTDHDSSLTTRCDAPRGPDDETVLDEVRSLLSRTVRLRPRAKCAAARPRPTAKWSFP